MNFSSTTLLKLQRLSRVVKKELQLPVHIKSKEEIGHLLRRAGSESSNVNVAGSYSDFISTLTKEDKVELITYNVSITLNVNSSMTEVPPGSLQNVELDAPPPPSGRRQVNIPVKHERRIKERIYRGVVVSNNDRRQEESYDGSDKRGLGSVEQEKEMSERNVVNQHTYHGRAYRGVAIEEEAVHQQNNPIQPKKKKPARMYRGQPIHDDN